MQAYLLLYQDEKRLYKNSVPQHILDNRSFLYYQQRINNSYIVK